MQATVGVFGGSDPALDETVEEVARDVFRDTGVAIFASGESEIFTAGERSLVFGFFEELQDHASLVTGRWPKTTDPVAEVVMPEAAARASTSAWAIASMRAAASAPPKRARGSSASIARSASPPRTGVGQSALDRRRQRSTRHDQESFFGLGLQSTELSWRLEPRHDRIAIGEASEVRRKLSGMAGRLNAGRRRGRSSISSRTCRRSSRARSARCGSREPACSCRRSSLRSSPVMG